MAAIDAVIVAPNISAGLVKVSIVRDPTTSNDPNGCTVLGGIDLSNASDSEIPECRVQTNAATITGLTFEKLSGPLAVGGDIEQAVTITSLGGQVTWLGQQCDDPGASSCDIPCEEEGLMASNGFAAAASNDAAVGGLSAPYVATTLLASVAPERVDALTDAVADVAAFPPVTPITDWAQVAALLSGE